MHSSCGPRRILLAGCGKLGSGLAFDLVRQGHQVTGLKRQPPEDSLSHAGKAMQWIQADLLQADSLSRLQQPVDEVFYILTPGSRSATDYRAVYLTGVWNLHQRLSALGANPHWTFVSSTSVYGQQDGSWVDENSKSEPESETARVLIDAENHLRGMVESGTIVRLAGLYGPGRSALIRSVQRGDPVRAKPPYYTNRVHQEDAGRILQFLMERRLQGQTLEPVYLACDEDPAPKRVVVDWLAGKLGCSLPARLEPSDGAGQNKRCSNQRLKSLGYEFKYPDFRAGYEAILAEFSAAS